MHKQTHMQQAEAMQRTPRPGDLLPAGWIRDAHGNPVLVATMDAERRTRALAYRVECLRAVVDRHPTPGEIITLKEAITLAETFSA